MREKKTPKKQDLKLFEQALKQLLSSVLSIARQELRCLSGGKLIDTPEYLGVINHGVCVCGEVGGKQPAYGKGDLGLFNKGSKRKKVEPRLPTMEIYLNRSQRSQVKNPPLRSATMSRSKFKVSDPTVCSAVSLSVTTFFGGGRAGKVGTRVSAVALTGLVSSGRHAGQLSDCCSFFTSYSVAPNKPCTPTRHNLACQHPNVLFQLFLAPFLC